MASRSTHIKNDACLPQSKTHPIDNILDQKKHVFRTNRTCRTVALAVPFDGESSPRPTQSSSFRGLGWGALGAFPRDRWIGGAGDVM